MTPTDKAPKPGSDEAHSAHPWSVRQHTGETGRIGPGDDWSIHSADGTVLAIEGYTNPRAHIDVPLMARAPELLEEVSTLRASNAKLREALKQIAFTRKVGATPKLVPGSMIEKIECIALAALKETE